MNIKNRINTFERTAQAKRHTDQELLKQLEEAYDKYNHLPDNEAPKSWLRIKEILCAARKRKVDRQV